MITPTTIEIATTAIDCLKVACLSGHTIFLNSAFTPLKKPGDAFFSAESPILTMPFYNSTHAVIWFLCAVCVSDRICNVCSFQCGLGHFFCFSLSHNCDACIRYKLKSLLLSLRHLLNRITFVGLSDLILDFASLI